MNLLHHSLAVATASVGVGLGHQLWASKRTLEQHRGFQHFEVDARTGNSLSCHRRSGAPGGPELILETGLMNTSSSWLLLAALLPSPVSVTIYDRAGYRRSLRRNGEPYQFGESVSDAVDVVNAVRRDDAPIWLIGHSLGCYLAHRTASLVEDIAGLILIDPMHPQELVVSRQQREGARSIDLTLSTASIPVALGGGALLDKTGIFQHALGNPHLSLLRSDQSALGTWRTGLREWRFAYPFMLDGGSHLTPLGIPVHVLAAQATIEAAPEQLELYDDYVQSGSPNGSRIDIVESDHLGIINGPGPARRVAETIGRLVTTRTIHPAEEEHAHASH